MKYILAGIDGAGRPSWTPRSGGSVVRRFVQDFDPQGGSKAFFDGPGSQIVGSDPGRILQGVTSFIYASYHGLTNVQLPWAGPPDLPQGERGRVVRQIIQTISDRQVKIVLVGHGPGGLIAIRAAAGLQAPVDFLGLFDAVDRAYGPDASVIQNVRLTYHALRQTEISSRPTFGKTGRSSRGRYVERHVHTSHGGVGGACDPNPSGPGADVCRAEDYETPMVQSIGGGGGGPVAVQGPIGTRTALSAGEARNAEAWMRDVARRHGLSFRGR